MIRFEHSLAALCLMLSVIVLQSTMSVALIPPNRTRSRSSTSTTTSTTIPPPPITTTFPPVSAVTENTNTMITCTCAIVTKEIDTKLKNSTQHGTQHGTQSLLAASEEKIRRTIQQAILRFSLKFQHILSNTTENSEKNVIFAPINILSSLATLLLGSEAETRDEILNLLEFYAGKDLSEKYSELTIHQMLGGLFANFTAEGEHNPAVRTKMNQAIFLQTGTELKAEFLKHAKKFYDNELITLDYGNSDTAAHVINEWTSNRTEKRITEVIKAPLSVDTKLVLLSTLFFNGEWDDPFFNGTGMSPFYLEKKTIQVKTMSNSGMVYYNHNSAHNYSVFGLPYKGSETVMYIILPDNGQKLSHTLSKITAHELYDIMNNTVRDTDASYTLPYMRLSDSIGLKDMLEKLHVRNIFNPNAANLTRIAENIKLYVSEALHNVNLDITEAGSTGAASTAVVIETKFPSKKIILVNRPFSFYIIHRPSGVISFWGTIYDPRQGI